MNIVPLLTSVLAAGTLFAASLPAPAEISWMNEEAMRVNFIGKALQGHYYDRATWAASYQEGGRYDVREGDLHAKGIWYFRGRAFCFFYGPPSWALEERCAAATKISANCYEFHLVRPSRGRFLSKGDFRPDRLWHSRGWREGEPSTCEEKPTV